MTDTAKKTCPRCKGTGLVNSGVVYAGIPGGCFHCAATGAVFRDKFVRAIGASGEFFGFSFASCRNGKTIKMIARGTRSAIEDNLIDGVSMKQITEEQARKFFASYGLRAEV